MTRTSAKEVIQCGIVFTYSTPKELPIDKGRTKTRWECLISSKLEGTKQKLFEIKKIRLSTQEAVLARIESQEDVLQILKDNENFEKLVALTNEKNYRITAYLFLLGKSDAILMSSYSGVTQETIDNLLSGKNTTRVFDEIYLDAPIDYRSAQKLLNEALRADKMESKDNVETAIALLSAIFAEAMKLGLADRNPYAKKPKSKTEQAKMIENMGRRSLSDEESTAFANKCLDGLSNGSLIYGVILLCFLLGMTVYEACALRWEDWQASAEGDVSWLCITKELYQKRYKKASLRYKLRSLYQYRKVACTEEVEIVLRRCMAITEDEGKIDFTGLIFHDADGNYLLPERVKRRINQLLDEILPNEGLNLEGYNTRFGRKDKRAITRGDFLRRHFEYILRIKSMMEPSEIQAIMGISPDDTYAHSYIDWSNIDVLRCERAKIERWHKQLATNMSSGKDAYCQTTQMLLVAVGQNEDATIYIDAKFLAKVNVAVKG